MIIRTLAVLGPTLLLMACGTPDNVGRFDPPDITLREHGHLKELIDDRLTFIDSSGTEWIAPRGTLTDGASVPRLALSVTDGRWERGFLKAAVVHDAYCQLENKDRTPDQYLSKSWKAVHRMFYEASIAGGTPPLKAKIMFAGVWLGGPRWDDPDRDLERVSGEVLTRGFTASKKWIEETDPDLEQIVTNVDAREPLLLDLYDLETGILAALQQRNTPRAQALIRDEDALLTQAMDKSPDDLMLLNFRGYWHKNRAMLLRMSGIDHGTAELISSERAFEAVIANEPQDPSALNGLGSVAILRGDLIRAEEYVRKALAVNPNYEAARMDLQLIENLRMQRVRAAPAGEPDPQG